MSEIRKAVLRFTRRSIGQALLAALTLGVLPQAVEAFRPHLFGGGGGGGGPSAFSTTVTLVNDSGSSQTSGVPTQTFGQVFKDGDIPSGHVPQFKVGGVTQPFSAGLQRYYKSGALMFATFQLLPTFTIAGSGSQAVTITDGGAGPWPSASGRSLSTDVYPQGMEIVCPPLSPTIGGRSGTISSWCNGDANTYKISKWLDGGAGTGWKISCNMASTVGGSADGQLATNYYVQALNNASGGAGAFRVLHHIRQPFYNYDGGLGKQNPVAWVAPNSGSPASGLNWVENSNSHAWTWFPSPASATFTSDGAGNYAWTSIPGWYDGAGGDGTLLPVVISGGVGFLWMSWNTYPPTAGTLRIWNLSNMESDSGQTLAAGTFTATLVAAQTPFTVLQNATTTGHYNFFVGSGTSGISAETTLRVVQNQQYWQSSGVIPAFDLGSIGSVADTTYTFAWNPYNRCDVSDDTGNGTGGDLAWLGIIPGMAANDFFTPSVNSDRAIRFYGHGGGLWAQDLHDKTTDTNLNFLSASYTGVAGTGPSGPVYSTVYWSPRGNYAGFTNPGSNVCSWGMYDDVAHEPNMSTWAYYRTGELQYLDHMVNNAQRAISTWPISVRNPTVANGDSPYNAIGVTTYVNTQYRAISWTMRAVEYAALLYSFDPTGANPVYTEVSGSQMGQYLNDLGDASCKFPVAQFGLVCADSTQYLAEAQAIYNVSDPSAYAYCFNAGIWLTLNNNGSGVNVVFQTGATYELTYVAWVMCVAAARGNLDARSFLQNIIAKYWNYMGNNFGWFFNYAYLTRQGEYYPSTPFTALPSGANPPGTPVSSDARYGWGDQNWRNGSTTWSTAGSPYFTVSTLGSAYNWTGINNGDIYIPNPSYQPLTYPVQLDYTKTYYVRDLSGSGVGATFNLAEGSPTNAAIAIVSGSCTGATKVSGGGSYSVNDVLTITGGTVANSGIGGSAAQITVNTVSGGVIQTFTVTNPGMYSAVPTGTLSVTGGTGTGATFTATWGGNPNALSGFMSTAGKLNWPGTPNLLDAAGYGVEAGYPYQMRSLGCWANSLGISGFTGGPVSPATTVVADVDYRILNAVGGPLPLVTGQAAGGNYTPNDCRYAYQDTFYPATPDSPPS
jgi:hypothetical protein